MIINFIILGRLGNAIFRYLACSILCSEYNAEYVINKKQQNDCSDEYFCFIMDNLKNNNKINIHSSLNMNGFYQHDFIYNDNKLKIYDFIQKHPEHFVLTDGVTGGDGINEKFFMIDILYTPQSFTKRYKNVLHIRLEDFVTYNLYTCKTKIIDLLNKYIRVNELCIVCKKPTTDFENNYISHITNYLKNKNIQFTIESNDTITDYYIMKEAELLICSKSTLSWCAAYFSDKIKQCYLPDYLIQPCTMTCKKPIENTILY